MRVKDILLEPLNIHDKKNSKSHKMVDSVLNALREVGLGPPEEIADRPPLYTLRRAKTESGNSTCPGPSTFTNRCR